MRGVLYMCENTVSRSHLYGIGSARLVHLKGLAPQFNNRSHQFSFNGGDVSHLVTKVVFVLA